MAEDYNDLGFVEDHSDLGFLPHDRPWDISKEPKGFEMDRARTQSALEILKKELAAAKAAGNADLAANTQLEIDRLEKRLSFIPPVPVAAQADVRKAEPVSTATPMDRQQERETAWQKAWQAWTASGGKLNPGQTSEQTVSALSGMQDPRELRDAAEQAHLKQTGELQYGDSVPYAAAKGLAAVGGFVTAGPGGATMAESAVRLVSLVYNLNHAVEAGTISQEKAYEIFSGEMTSGAAQDLLYNVGVPLVGDMLGKIAQLAAKAPWVKTYVMPVLEKAANAAKAGVAKATEGAAFTKPTVSAAEGTAGGVAAEAAPATVPTQAERTAAQRVALAKTPVQKEAVQALLDKTEGSTVPTPGQVTGQAGFGESLARITHPRPFDQAKEDIQAAAEKLHAETVNPERLAMLEGNANGGQQTRLQMGQQIQQMAKDAAFAVKKRLGPDFEAAKKLGVGIDMEPVVLAARQALEEDATVLGGKLSAAERADLEKIAKPSSASTWGMMGEENEFGDAGTFVSPESALDFISRQKEKLRGLTADHIPSDNYTKLLTKLMGLADEQYVKSASAVGEGEVVRKLMLARSQYREMNKTVYQDAIKKVLRQDPENVGKLFWQSGTVSEVGQLSKLFDILYREKVITAKEILQLQKNMTRGFLQEAVPTVEAAAKWSETLAADPLKRDTWRTLTETTGGHDMIHAMLVLEEASKIALRGNPQLVGASSGVLIPLRRAAGLGMGVSWVTGALHPGMIIAGFSADAVGKLMATAYTKADKGTINLIARALKANSVGTAVSVKALQAMMPDIEKAANKYNINPFVEEGQQ